MESNDIAVKIKYVFVGVILLLIQTVCGNKMRIFGVAPNLVLCYVLTSSYRSKSTFGFYNALVFGLVLDSISGRIFGAYTIFFVLFDMIVENVFYKYFSENFVLEFFGGSALLFAFSFFYAVTVWLFNGNFMFLFFRICIVETVINSVLFFFFLLISKRKKKKRRSAFRV